jgi:hypothetical protein
MVFYCGEGGVRDMSWLRKRRNNKLHDVQYSNETLREQETGDDGDTDCS